VCISAFEGLLARLEVPGQDPTLLAAGDVGFEVSGFLVGEVALDIEG
jgi:hypothetical protein